MAHILQARCLNHPGREAVARCPVCRHMFCRECVTDHEGRVMCAKCLAVTGRAATPSRRRWVGLGTVFQAAMGFLLMWMLVYGVGRILLKIPHSFHEGTVWTSGWTDDD